MTRRTVAFRTDANSCIGMGHLIRCLALARMLEEEYSIVFLCTSTPDGLLKKFINDRYPTIALSSLPLPDEATLVARRAIARGACLLVLDGYAFDYEYQKKIHDTGVRIFYIDDLVADRYCVDLLINQAEGIDSEQYVNECSGKVLLGPRYALLRPEFLKLARHPVRNLGKIRNAFISFGGADPTGLTDRVLEILVGIPEIGQVDIVLGQVNQAGEGLMQKYGPDAKTRFHFDQTGHQIASLLEHNQLAIIPNSSIALEACAVGILMITAITADNQTISACSFRQHGLSTDLGDWRNVSGPTLMHAVLNAVRMPIHDQQEQLQRQKAYLDGFSDQRIREQIHALCE